MKEDKEVSSVWLRSASPSWLWQEFKDVDKSGKLPTPMSGYGYYVESIQSALRHHLEYDVNDCNLKMMSYWIEDLLSTRLYLTGMKIDYKSQCDKDNDTKSRDEKDEKQRYITHKWWHLSNKASEEIETESCKEFDETIKWITTNVPAFKFSWNRSNHYFS
jgi:hypothetical protein